MLDEVSVIAYITTEKLFITLFVTYFLYVIYEKYVNKRQAGRLDLIFPECYSLTLI